MATTLDITKEKVRERVDPEMVLDRLGIEYTVHGGRELRLRCPIHHGSDENFSWNLDTGIWSCFSHSCGTDRNVPRDIFLFVQMVKKISFVDAVRYLGSLVGMSGEDFEYNKEEDDKYKITRWLRRQRSLQRDNEEPLDESILGHFDKRPHPYLINRGFTEDVIREWEMCYAHRGEFAGRVIMPIRDDEGRLVGLSGRLATDDPIKLKKEPKYRNLANFSRGAVLFGLHKAKPFVQAYDEIILVEGQLDVAKAWQNGMPNVCATMGTTILPEQIDLVVANTSKVVLAYDTDRNGAGQKGTWRITQRLKDYCDVRIMELPIGKDVEKLTGEELWGLYDKTISPVHFFAKWKMVLS